MHAAAIAYEMKIKRVIITPGPGLFSSFGLLFAQVEHRLIENFFHPLDEERVAQYANEVWEKLRKEAIAEIEAGGYGKKPIIEKFADLRYTGQSSELTIPISWDRLRKENVPMLIEKFNDEHLRTYAHKRLGEPVTAVSLGVKAVLGLQDIPKRPRKGPVIIELYDSTCVVPPYGQFSAGPWGTIVIDIKS